MLKTIILLLQVRSQLDLDESNSCKITVQSFRKLDEGGSGEIVAYYKNDVVMVYYSAKHDVNLTRKDLIELVKVRGYGCTELVSL